MNMRQVYGVILAGGTGQRLWPKSRRNLPKYALSLDRGRTLIQEAFRRIKTIIPADRILVVTERSQVGLIKKELPGLKTKNIIAEPFGRNTAAAIGLAAVYVDRESPDGVMVVLPADQLSRNRKKFGEVIRKAVDVAARGDSLVTLGVRPSFAATGFGYIKTEDRRQRTEDRRGIYKVARFVEKPNKKTALRFVNSGKYLWNSGIFIWKADAIMRAISSHMPGLYSGLERLKKLIGRKGYREYLDRLYRRLDGISIDHGVLEKAGDVVVVKAGFDWDDLGSWAGLTRLYKKDRDGNIVSGNFKGIDSTNSIIIGESGHLIGAVGIDGLVVVHTPEATLVCGRENSEQVKELVQALANEKELKRYL